MLYTSVWMIQKNQSEEVDKDLILDYNEEGKVVGIEILNVSKRTDKIDFNSLQFETV